MKQRFLNNTVAMLSAMLCLAVNLTSCANKQDATSTAEQPVAADSRFVTLDSLAVYMIQDLMDRETPEELVEQYESQSAAISAYWAQNHAGDDQSLMTETVMGELKTLADSLSAGSTVDMMMCGEIHSAIAQYLTAQAYCEHYRDNPLYQAEMRDWLLLEDELMDFYGDLATLTYWGGTITTVVASSTIDNLCTARHDDYSQLKKGGQFASGEMTIAEARANLIEELSSAKSLEDDAVEENAADFRQMLNEMREHADKVAALLDKWIASRAALCQAEGIPEGHTARLIAQLSRLVMEIIEG